MSVEEYSVEMLARMIIDHEAKGHHRQYYGVLQLPESRKNISDSALHRALERRISSKD